MVPKNKINFQIRHPEIRVIDDEGNQLGIMSPGEALEKAREEELDLVEVSPNAQPPVCKITDWGKFQYQLSKQDRVNKSKQKKVEIKGVRIGLKTDVHDLEFKRKQAEKFLSKGHKVKAEIILKGRENIHKDLAKQNLIDFIEKIEIPYKMEQEIEKFPKGFNSIIAPE